MTNIRTAPKSAKVKDLTETQHAALVCIRNHIRVHTISPTLEEVAARLGIVKTAARQTIFRLCRDGYLGKAPGRFRNIVVTHRGRIAANQTH